MSRFFIIAVMTGLMMLLTMLLVWWFGFYTTEAPRVFLSLGYADMGTGVPVAFFFLTAWVLPARTTSFQNAGGQVW